MIETRPDKSSVASKLFKILLSPKLLLFFDCPENQPDMSLMLIIHSLELEADKLDICIRECISRLENSVGSNQPFSEAGVVDASTGTKS